MGESGLHYSHYHGDRRIDLLQLHRLAEKDDRKDATLKEKERN